MATDVASPYPPAAAESPAAALWLADGGRRALLTVVLPLLAVAVVAWAITVRGEGMPGGAAAFVTAWLIMMVAMMLPAAAAPVVALYALAARRGVVAAVPVFVAGYLLVWAVTGLPALAVAEALAEPLTA